MVNLEDLSDEDLIKLFDEDSKYFEYIPDNNFIYKDKKNYWFNYLDKCVVYELDINNINLEIEFTDFSKSIIKEFGIFINGKFIFNEKILNKLPDENITLADIPAIVKLVLRLNKLKSFI